MPPSEAAGCPVAAPRSGPAARPRAIIFDVDGTLAETEELHRLAFNGAFREFGLDWDWSPDLYRRLLKVTGGKERLAHYIAAHTPSRGAEMLERVAELHAAKTARYTALVETGPTVLRPGIARLIREARAEGVAVALATTTSPENVAALLRAAGREVEQAVGVIAAGDMVARKKPAPDVYHLALRMLELEAEECLAVEDSAAGVAAARAAGLPVLVTCSSYTDPGPLEGTLCALSDLGEADAPCRRIGGSAAADGPMVTLATIRRWMAAA